MVLDAKEALGSMGDDTPMAVLSSRYRGLHHFFRQQFSQVTNPPIDPLRRPGDEPQDPLRQSRQRLRRGAQPDEILLLESPVLLLTTEFETFLRHFGRKATTLDCTFEVDPIPALARGARPHPAGGRGRGARGYEQIVLSDEAVSETRAPIPMILAVGAVHSHLVRQGLRSFSSITVRSGECLDVHYVAVLIGVGATAVNPASRRRKSPSATRGLFPGHAGRMPGRYKEAVDQGLLKIISKMDIRSSAAIARLQLRGDRPVTVVVQYFPGLNTLLSASATPIQKKVLALHRQAYAEDNPPLQIGGLYRYFRGGERHALEGPAIHQLQYAVATDSTTAFEKYTRWCTTPKPVSIRDLLGFDRRRHDLVPVDEAESITEIRKRFVTPGMSLGALSPEAHETVTIAVNRIGKSDSGEGGEGKERCYPRPTATTRTR